MANLAQALPWVLRHEGGWSDDAADPGGATNYGITLATAQRHGIMDADALRAITPEQVEAIYRQDYWRFDGIDSQAVATKVFDMAVNMGLRTAIHLVQEVLNGLGAAVQEDGYWGPNTLAALNACRPDRVLDLLCMESAEHYQLLAANRPASGKFLKGWLARAAEVPSV